MTDKDTKIETPRSNALRVTGCGAAFRRGGVMDARTLTHNLGGYWRNGRGQAPCPICQPERRKDQTALSISEQNGKILMHCFKAACSFVDIGHAANMTLNNVKADHEAQREMKAKQVEYQARQLAKARSLWDFAKLISGTKADAYLRGRGITCDLPESLRFMPDLYHAPSASWGCAMIANAEPIGGVHRTFLDKQGQRKPKSAKMMLGPCSGGAVHLSDTVGPLVVCEGIETGLSLLSGLLSNPATVWAALSTTGMKALRLPSDPGELIIATDGDDAGRDAGNSLGTQASALGWSVSLMPAPDKQDWNDVLQSVVAA